MRDLPGRLNGANYDLAVRIASVPEGIRGYGYIKMRNLAEAKTHEAQLLKAFDEARERVEAA